MELQDYAKILRAHWVAVLVCTALGIAAALGWAALQEKVYTANASAIITTGVSEDLGSAMIGDNYAKSRVKSYVDIAKSRRVAEYAIDALGLDISPQALVGQVSVSNPLDTAVLRITANGDSPEQARDIAEAWIQGMVVSVDLLENNAESQDELTGAEESVVRLQTLDAAVLPGGPSFPNTKLAVALGGLVGLALGIALALVRGAIDRRLRTPAQVEQEFELPVLGVIPHDAQIAKLGASAKSTDFATTESVRELRTNLQFMDVDNPPRLIVVTSALPGDGKSTVTIRLAEAIAESGQKVIVVDADLRRSKVVDYLGLVEGAGLTDVLVGRAELDDVLQPYGPTGKFFVLGAGTTPPNPSELLGSSTMRDLLHAMDPSAIVLIDTPPLIPVTDAAILTARTDGALVVVRAGRTTVDILDRALVNLDRVKGRPLGVIMDGVARKGADATYYDYTYETPRESKGGRAARRASAPNAEGSNASL